MGKIKQVHWKEFEKFLLLEGCVFKREKGDHRIYSREGLKRSIVVPRYNPLPVFIIMNNLRILKVSKKVYLKSVEKL